ncbi:hypothetical protein GJ496_012046 [Pomphorhynchus laevis]|nr:hypothetical protein GJ496_012046 [Pomphorhynchus laevis]
MIKLLFCAVAIISISSGYNDYEDYKYKLGKGVALTHAADYLSERSPLLAKRYIGRPAMYGHGLSGYYGGRIAGLGEKYGLMHGASYGYPRYGGIGARYGSMHKGSFGYPLSGSLGEIYGSVHRSYGYPRYGGLGGGYGSMYKGAYGYPRYGGLGGGYGSMYKGLYGYPRYSSLGGGYGSIYKGAYGYPSRFHHHMHCPHSNSMYGHRYCDYKRLHGIRPRIGQFHVPY